MNPVTNNMNNLATQGVLKNAVVSKINFQQIASKVNTCLFFARAFSLKNGIESTIL